MSQALQTNSQLDNEKLNRDLMEQIILGVAHELNNPNSFVRLNAMTIKKLISMLAPCLDEYEDNHPDAKFGKFTISELRAKLNMVADGILEASVRIITIADKLKDLSSFSLSAATKISMVELLKNMINMHQFVSNQLSSIELIHDPEKSCLFKGHSLQLDQALSILLTNAGDAVREHLGNEAQSRGTIKIYLDEDEKRVIIRFVDNGCGMDEELQKKIFTPYFTTKPQGVGDGLGLPLCLSTIQRHGGSIRVKSEKGKGAEFTVILPKSAED